MEQIEFCCVDSFECSNENLMIECFQKMRWFSEHEHEANDVSAMPWTGNGANKLVGDTKSEKNGIGASGGLDSLFTCQGASGKMAEKILKFQDKEIVPMLCTSNQEEKCLNQHI